MFNYNLDQATANPNPNNFCGGYALAAVINSIQGQPLNQPAPLPVYNQIQQNQIGIGVCSQGLIQNTLQNGTAISLPSSIAITAQNNYVFATSVIHWAQNLLTVHLRPILPEEIVRLDNAAINNIQNNNNLATILAGQANGHFIVLVADGAHWIAIEKHAGGLRGYDPAQTFPTDAITINGDNINQQFTYSGVMITISTDK